MNDNDEDLVLIREILAREIETINTYQRMLRDAKSSEVISFLTHIIDEEKEHVAEALDLIKEYDPVQAGLLESSTQHWRATATQTNTAYDPQQTGETRFLTVGSLRGSGKP